MLAVNVVSTSARSGSAASQLITASRLTMANAIVINAERTSLASKKSRAPVRAACQLKATNANIGTISLSSAKVLFTVCLLGPGFQDLGSPAIRESL